jgi:hypothetical protein
MHFWSILLGFVLGVVASVLYSLFRPAKWGKLQKETGEEIGKAP